MKEKHGAEGMRVAKEMSLTGHFRYGIYESAAYALLTYYMDSRAAGPSLSGAGGSGAGKSRSPAACDNFKGIVPLEGRGEACGQRPCGGVHGG